jgi:hypothetical protein
MHMQEFFAKYRWRTYSRWKIALISVVSSSGMSYASMVSVSTEEHYGYMTYTATYPPSSTRTFNVARTVLHTL